MQRGGQAENTTSHFKFLKPGSVMVICINSLCSPLQLISEVNNGLVHSSLSCLMWLGQMQRWESTACHGCGLVQIPHTWINIHFIMSLSGRSGWRPNLKQDKGKTLLHAFFLAISCTSMSPVSILSNSHELITFK